MSEATDGQITPPAAQARLEQLQDLLDARQLQKVVLVPLLLRQSLDALLARRSKLFTTWRATRERYGHHVSFAQDVRPTDSHPEGRRVEGDFDIISLSASACLLAYDLNADQEDRGPRLLARSAYPLGSRPFMKSRDLLSHILRLSRQNGWVAVCTDAMGYDRETQEFRRDMKHQPATTAFREMADQGRLVHQMRVSFRDRDDRERLLATINRYGRAALFSGDLMLTLERLIAPAISMSARRSDEVAVSREAEPHRQMVVRLQFPSNTFATRDEIRVLCEAIRNGAGLSLTTVHLNPYLNSQVLDWLTGDTLQLTVTDPSSATIIPWSSRPRGATQRVIETIFRYFGEADIFVDHVPQASGATA